MWPLKSKEEKAFERRMAIKKTLNSMRNRIKELEVQVTKYVESARVAVREELPEQVKLARQAIKQTVAERKRMYKMLLNYEIIMQIRDNAEMNKQFLKGIAVLSKEMMMNTAMDMEKIQSDLNIALGRVEAQKEAMDDLITENESQFNSPSTNPDSEFISENEIDELIFAKEGTSPSTDVEKTIDDLGKKK